MTRKECLEQAMGCVLHDRNNEYGKPEDCFGVIANFWSVYLGCKVYPADVAMMMSLLKIARIKANKGYADGYVDLAGYAACGAECAEGKPASKPKADEGPEFKRGDEVQCRVTLPSVSDRLWVDGEYVRYEKGRSRPHVVFTNATLELVSDEDIRPAPKAEGCEALVEKDAPQTKEELMQRIVDCNPATFHTPSYAEEQLEHHSRLQAHKPTGEELAEMAEEEQHG